MSKHPRAERSTKAAARRGGKRPECDDSSDDGGSKRDDSVHTSSYWRDLRTERSFAVDKLKKHAPGPTEN
ncbi:hypothetical protein TSA66_02710 [Noviherbaspirillum autotrophicum]|uniref:Uncharacterized protein n=1 Tax=Noviherbaspirillum autotrophicum TaxID=709839 RepID=A0A0C2BFH2_9BURK|nr:hypothetical protein TSA66_02710 [Noviherbaspirillum autotrophicum]